jgi:hypothetical protein
LGKLYYYKFRESDRQRVQYDLELYHI